MLIIIISPEGPGVNLLLSFPTRADQSKSEAFKKN